MTMLEAAVFDLDGVVTLTARLHFASWKRLFDDFLRHRARAQGQAHRPFDEADYLAHVDGRPRSDGIRTFLAARGLTLPEGSPADPATAATVSGLSQRKNALFLALLDRQGVDIDPGAVDLVRALLGAGVRVGVASSSRNAAALLHRAGLDGLFEARVDGVVSAELGLRGKPDPDAFLECLRRLEVAEPEHAMVVEDAASGVTAGLAGGFGLVVGVDRGGNWLRLRQAGAHWIVGDMAEASFDNVVRQLEARPQRRPSALTEWPAIAESLRGRRLAVFLDYDGTLTPIVASPELAVLDDGTRAALERLSRVWPTHIISGRGLDDVKKLVGIDSLWMAGSHGFDIAGPGGTAAGKQAAPEIEPVVHRAADELRRATAGVPGARVEDKRFSIAVHHRLVDLARRDEVERAVDDALARHPGLRKTLGKKVWQLEPAIDWDKGRALSWILEATGQLGAYPIYIGDDDTDEAALRAVAERGLGVVVTEIPRPTAARYALQDPFEVRELLERLRALADGEAG